jgi:hypothetical protein
MRENVAAPIEDADARPRPIRVQRDKKQLPVAIQIGRDEGRKWRWSVRVA